MLWHASCCIEHVVSAVALADPWTLGIAILILWCFPGRIVLLLFGHTATSVHARTTEALFVHIKMTDKSAQGDHVRIEFYVIEFGISPVEISFTVIVYQDRRIDIVPAALIEWLAKSILERTCRRVGYSHTNGHGVGQLADGTDIPIELTVTLTDLCGPGAVIGPFEGLKGQRRTTVGPVDHIGGAINTPLLHPEEVGIILVMSGIDIERVIMHKGCRVGGEAGLDDGVLSVHGY